MFSVVHFTCSENRAVKNPIETECGWCIMVMHCFMMVPLLISVLFLSIFFVVSDAQAEIPSRLRRIDIRPHEEFTRLVFQLDKQTVHSFTELSSKHVRLTLENSDGPLFRRLRTYTDRHIGGIQVTQRGETLLVTISLKNGTEGMRILDGCGEVLTLDIGPTFQKVRAATSLPEGRESIWNGAGRFISGYDPVLKSDLPFIPTDIQALRGQLSDQEARLFLLGEAALYKGAAAEASQIFETLLNKESAVRSLVAFRAGEARYLLQDYPRALQLFREGERLWPQFLQISPGTAFYYADSLVRNGDLPAGRKLLARLIASHAEKKTAPILMVRLADILTRQKRDIEAVVLYRTVVKYFPENKAASHAALKLADRRFLAVDEVRYASLRNDYRRIAQGSSDFLVREEALFKAALLDALFSPSMEALTAVSGYEKRYPRGIFASIVRTMHEDILPVVYRDLMVAQDGETLVNVAERHALYLEKCLSDQNFIRDLDAAYTDLGRMQEELHLFARLVRREWASSQMPFMYNRMLDNALALADWKTAEGTSREYLQRFPSSADASRVREILGDIEYRKGNLAGVCEELKWLLNARAKAAFPESYYYLGKSLEAEKQPKLAGRAMEQFIAAMHQRKATSPLVVDAYFVAASALHGAGSIAKALESYRAGLTLAAPDGRDRFLYRIGDICLREGRNTEAKGYWDKILKEGNDAVWQKLASQAMADLEWRERTGARL